MNQPTLFTTEEPKSTEVSGRAETVRETIPNTSKIVFFDTETTGLGPKHRLCQLAYKTNGREYESLFKPPLPIDPGASAITGITNESVASKEPFIGSEMAANFQQLANDDTTIFVAHNADFDIEMLQREGISINKHFDTLRIARVLDDGQAKNYRQEYLREYFDLNVDDARAHDALGDVRVLEALFKRLTEIIIQSDDYSDDVNTEMTRIMQKPILYKKFTFGKYRGQLISDVAQKDVRYLKWLQEQKKSAAANGQKDPDWVHTLNHYLGKK